MEARDLGALLLLGALWGASFLFIEIAVPALGPVLLVNLRVLLAAGALALCAVAVGSLPALRARWKEFLFLGGLNAAAPFTLIATSQLNLTASLAAILNSTTPLFGAVVAAVWIGEALTVRKAVGLLLGVAGVAVLVGLDPVPLSGVVLLAVGASLLAALRYAAGGGGGDPAAPGRRHSSRRAAFPRGRALRAGAGPALDGGRLPALLPTYHQRRAHEDPHRNVPGAGLRCAVWHTTLGGALEHRDV